MVGFSYRAVGRGGEMLRGEIEAASREAVILQLHAEGSVPLHVARAAPGARQRQRSRADIAAFISRLATLVGAGVAVESAVGIIAASPRDPVLRGLRAGLSLAEALEGFPPLVTFMVGAGERSGDLPQTLSKLGEYLRRSEEARQSIRSALIYPAILLLAASASVVIVFTAVLPALRPVVDVGGATLPLPVRLAFGISDALQAYWWVPLLALAAVAVVLRRHFTTASGRARRDRLLLRLPLFGTAVLRAAFARFARTLGTLLGGGVPMQSALEAAGKVVSNEAVAATLAQVTETVRQGGGLADPLAAAGCFPDMAVQIVRIGEATGQLDRMLLQLAEIMEQDLRRDLGRALALLVPALTVGLGLMVAGIVASVMLAVLSINDLAQ